MSDLFNTVQDKINRLPADHRCKWQVSLDVITKARATAAASKDYAAVERIDGMARTTERHIDVLLADATVKNPTWED
jgi:hypothetical protein